MFEQDCHPEIADNIRRLYQHLRDLLFGAVYLLGFGKEATVVIYPWKSLDLQAVRGRRFLVARFRLRL